MKPENNLWHLCIPLPSRPTFISPPQTTEIYDCVLRLRSVLRVTTTGRMSAIQARKKSSGILNSLICTLQRRGMAERGPEAGGNGTSGVSGGCRCRTTTKRRANERITWRMWATTSGSTYDPCSPVLTGQPRFSLRLFFQWLAREIFFQPSFWRLLLPTPVSTVTGWPLQMGERDSPILTYPKRTLLSATLTSGTKAFNYLAFLLINYTAFGLILQSHLALQISMQGLWKTPLFIVAPQWGAIHFKVC